MAGRMVYQMVCRQCGTVGFPRTYTKGSIWVELILWVCLLVPGLIYSLWRVTSRYKGCPACGAAGMIPLNAPMAKEILGRTAATPRDSA